ncbi:MAG: DoxX family protein [Acidobacteriota bacterium]|nr:DoxX family protein [Acidobacteriota bacterium]
MRKVKPILKYLLAVFFVVAGLNHFTNPNFYLKIMPPYLPWHLPLIYLSGLFEVALGILLLIPHFTHIAAWGLIALLIAVFPANIHMAVNHGLFPEYRATTLWLRLPLQVVLMALLYWYAFPVVPRDRSADEPLRSNPS